MKPERGNATYVPESTGGDCQKKWGVRLRINKKRCYRLLTSNKAAV